MDILNKYFYFNPDSEIKIKKGDILILIGDRRSINYFKNKVQQINLW
jgi:K+/H+ antiporter YhaU regulatory subunit KhtT